MVFGVRQILFFYYYFPFFVVLIKGHGIRERCERDKKRKRVRKTGKLRWGEEGWKNRGMRSSDIQRHTKRERMGRHQTFRNIA